VGETKIMYNLCIMYFSVLIMNLIVDMMLGVICVGLSHGVFCVTRLLQRS
jgi:hypothetical protein